MIFFFFDLEDALSACITPKTANACEAANTCAAGRLTNTAATATASLLLPPSGASFASLEHSAEHCATNEH